MVSGVIKFLKSLLLEILIFHVAIPVEVDDQKKKNHEMLRLKFSIDSHNIIQFGDGGTFKKKRP